MGAISQSIKAGSKAGTKAATKAATKAVNEKDLSAIKAAGRKAHQEQASARAEKNAEIAEQQAKLPKRSKKASEEFGLYHPVGGGLKLSRPVSGLHATTVRDPMFNPPEIGMITPERLVKEEAALFPLVGDRAAAGRYLTHIGETELERPVRLTGGPLYMDANYNLIDPEQSAAWESGAGRVTALSRQAARAGEGGRPVYGIYTTGSATNTDFNIMGADALIQQLPYSKITKKAEREFDRAMREGSKAFPPIPDWPGIRSPKAEEMLLDKSNGMLRTKLFDTMGKENFQSMGFPDVAATRKAIIQPELLDVDTHQTGFRLARMDTTGRTIENPLIPSDYPVAMAGQVAGQLDVPVDYKNIFQSHFDARRLLGQPESGDYYSFSRAHPIQYADEEWLNRLMEHRYQLERKFKEGRAEGGLVSPEGIPPIATDLEMEFQQYQVGGAVRRAAAAAAKKTKGLGEKAAEAAMKSTKTPRDEAIIAARDASKQGFLGPSKEKGVFYHATHEDFSKFRPSHRGAHFVTKDPEFANEFLGIYDEGYEMKPGANIMPVHVQAQNPFDYENPEHIQMVLEKYRIPQGVSPEKVRDNLEVGNWNFIEDRNIQRAIKESGFDSFYVNEYGTKNLGLFEPTQIKSAIGMQGSYDVTDPDITKAEGGSVRLSDDIRARLAQKMGFAEGGSVEGWKDRLAKKMAEGGAVKMAEGGDLPQDELAYMAEALSPERESEDSETAKKIRAAIKAGKVIATSLPKALVSPVVGLYGTAKSGKYGTREGVVAGEKAMEEFMEPSEETVKELQADPLAMGYLENVGKFMEELETKYKLPPLMPELYGVATGTRGVIPQVKDLTKKGAAKAKEAVSEVPTLPVGLSMEPVGKPVSQVISEAKPGKIKVEANEAGFYSPIEKAVVNLQRKQGPGQAFLSDIMKFNPSKGELEATGIADWLKDQKSVTKQEVMDYINGNKVELVETVRGTVLSDADRQKFNDINRRISRGFKEMITPEEEEFFEATRAKLAEFKEPRFERENLILPGGANYREILLKLPVQEKKYAYEVFDPATQKATKFNTYDEALKFANQKGSSQSVLAKVEVGEDKTYKSSHWPDDPNTLAHMRVQDMKINGKKTLMIEEIQSDWHQEGRERGYKRSKDLTPDEIDLRFIKSEVPEGQDPSLYPGYYEAFDKETGEFLGRHSGTLNHDQAMRDAVMSANQFQTGVPDAPFKKDWYQLAIKRLFKYAADNDYDQIALVGPEEQIRRGSLGTHIDGLFYEKAPDGSIKLEAEKNGKVVLDKVVKPDDLELYVGKDVAKRIIQSDEKDGTLSGDDLKIGGEGMRQYYDRSYPDSMNKIGKKYGAKLEKRAMTINEYGPDDVETVQTGEADRFGREVIAYKVVDPETDKVIAYEYDFDKALREANKSVPQTSYWLMDLSPDMKKDVRIGQPFKKGGAVKMRRGGPIVSTYDTIPDITDAGQIKLAALEQELRNYA